MFKIDTTNIKEMTKQKIAYSYYEREENMRKNKIRNLAIIAFIFSFFIGGTITVNALTDNKIADTVKETFKEVLKVKSDGKEYDANCHKEDNGSITCTLPEELTGKDAESVINIFDGNIENLDVEYNKKDGEETVSITINE